MQHAVAASRLVSCSLLAAAFLPSIPSPVDTVPRGRQTRGGEGYIASWAWNQMPRRCVAPCGGGVPGVAAPRVEPAELQTQCRDFLELLCPAPLAGGSDLVVLHRDFDRLRQRRAVIPPKHLPVLRKPQPVKITVQRY